MFEKKKKNMFLLAIIVSAATLPSNPADWDATHVLSWLDANDLDALKPTSKAMAIDGVMLLHMEEADLRDEYRMRNREARKVTMAKIHGLRPGASASEPVNGVKAPLPQRDWVQFRAMKRRTTDTHMLLLLTYPRVGLMLLADAYDARERHGTAGGHMFGQGLTIPESDAFPLSSFHATWALFSPHTFIAVHRASFFGGLPLWYVIALVLGAMGEVAMVVEFFVMCCFPAMVQTALFTRLLFPLMQIVGLVLFYVLHIVTPYWLTDIAFYVTILAYVIFTLVTIALPALVCCICDARGAKPKFA